MRLQAKRISAIWQVIHILISRLEATKKHKVVRNKRYITLTVYVV